MQFLLTIHHDEKAAAKATDTERKALFAQYGTYTEELKKAGVMKGGEALQPSSQSSRVAVREGKRNVIDGPFSEAKEVLGGFYLIECGTKEEAVKWAAKCPGASYGTMGVHAIRAM
jgi:hypothetical protein